MDARVATRYAQSLFDVASKQNIVSSVSDDLASITAALEHDPRFKSFINNPAMNRESKLKLMEGVFSDRTTALTMQLFRLLLEKRRESLIHLVAQEFDRFRRAASNTLFAQVVSAMPLTEAEQKAIVGKLETSSKQKVEATFEVDASLMSGVKVHVGNSVMDGTVRGSLDRLRDKLLYDVLKQA
ncbi:MAG: ATP synthase F1 subunit delta [Chthonomonas sp.]|nr:ATP synthase F1 subunit delta [Chthonomonas sp.]